MNHKATGYYILVEMDEIEKEQTSTGGIIIQERDRTRVQAACDTGKVLDIGPLSFAGYNGVPDGCKGVEAAKHWGLKVGDRVIYESYQGKSLEGLRAVSESDKEQNALLRLIPDSQIMGVIGNE